MSDTETDTDASLRARVDAEIERRVTALRSMSAFREFIEPSGHPDFSLKPARHHEVMIKAFEGLEYDDYDRLALSCPPGAAK